MSDEAVYSRAAIAKRLREIRRVHGLTQTEISQRLGTSQQIWNNCETGDNIISLTNAVRIFEKLGVHLHYIYYGQDEAFLSESYKESRKRLYHADAKKPAGKPRRRRH